MDESPLREELREVFEGFTEYVNSLHQREVAIEQKETDLARREASLARREQEIESLNRMFEH